jgi:hypothetical protein
MTLRDLLAETTEADLDKEIIIQKDAEGNSYSPLACCGLAGYEPYNTWSGETIEDEDTHLILVPVN